MRRFFIGVALTLLATAASAVPARRDIRIFTQSDGSTIALRLIGDETFHTYVTVDNLPVAQTSNGDFHYTTVAGISPIVAHNPGSRAIEESTFISDNAKELNIANLSKANEGHMRRSRGYDRIKARSSGNISQVPTTGSPRVPVLLLEYADYPFRDGQNAHATFTDFFNNGDESARQYFIDQSNGKYTPQFDVYGPYTLSKNRAAYGGNTFRGDDKGVGTMVGEGCLGLASQIDFSLYDNNNDGECDVVIVIYAGDGEASSEHPDKANAVWPCQWELSASDFNKALTLNGVKIDKFGVFNELNGFDMSRIDGIGTFCHEFSHCLGLPDFYCTTYAGYFGMSDWSLMDYGCYNNEGYTPIGYSAYEKNFMGWIDYTEPVENTRYTLPVFNSKNADNDVAVKVSSSNRNEYYIIENRARQGWDRYMPAEGMMITHVTYDPQKWESNSVNNYSTQGMTIIPADNNLYNKSYDALAGDLWPYNGNDALTDDSRPAAVLNLGSRRRMGKPITEMTLNPDGTASFWYVRGELPKISTPHITSIDHTPNGVTATWSHEPECDVTYSVEVRPHNNLESLLLLATDFTDENHGWTTTGFTEVTSDGLRMGSGKNLGAATSPAFIPDESSLTINFDAKYYSGDESSIRITTLNANGTEIESIDQQLTAQTAGYTVTLAANAKESNHLRIETFAAKKRAYVTTAGIYDGDISLAAESRTPEAETVRTYEGITSKSYTIADLDLESHYDLRVRAIASHPESFLDSDWSAYAEVSFTNSSLSTVGYGAKDTPEKFFNLQGIPVDASHLTPGIYIRHTPSATDKIIIR